MKKWLLNILRSFAVLLIISAFLAACTGGAEPAVTTQATTEAETETKVKETVTSANEESSAEAESLADTAWDAEGDEYSFVFYDDGTGEQYDQWDAIPFAYEWDGENLTISTDWMDIEGHMDEEGNLSMDGFMLVQVDEPSFYPGMNAGGMESEIEGEWVHVSEDIVLTFDGIYTAGYSKPDIFGSGTYSYDGEKVIVSFMNDDDEVEDFEGYLDGDGDLIIDIWGEGGYYVWTDPDSSEVDADITEILGKWSHSESGEYVIFDDDGTVRFILGDISGYVYPFTYDGDTVEFDDYTGHFDGDGDLIIHGIEGYFIHEDIAEDSDSQDYSESHSGSYETDDGKVTWELKMDIDLSEYFPFDGMLFDNDTEELCLTFRDNGYGILHYGESLYGGMYVLDGDELSLENQDEIISGIYDPEENIITIEGIEGYFYLTDRSSYYR